MFQHQPQHDGGLAGRCARLASWQGEVSSSHAVERQASLLTALHGRRQAVQEAMERASAARAYSSPLGADFWDRVASSLRRIHQDWP
jgi:hypothetical protein